jgi:hypothetical protein
VQSVQDIHSGAFQFRCWASGDRSC